MLCSQPASLRIRITRTKLQRPVQIPDPKQVWIRHSNLVRSQTGAIITILHSRFWKWVSNRLGVGCADIFVQSEILTTCKVCILCCNSLSWASCCLFIMLSAASAFLDSWNVKNHHFIISDLKSPRWQLSFYRVHTFSQAKITPGLELIYSLGETFGTW